MSAQEAVHTPIAETEAVTVVGRVVDMLGYATTSSEGEIGAQEIADRPISRRGEVLEAVPGVIITQHSGKAKANQYFLRGFNLDHGTDFALSADGMPINMRTHAHGQGYADVNFIIPELIDGISYSKGPFFAEVGDFSGAGAAEFHLFPVLPRGFATVTIGEDNFYRLALGESWKLKTGTMTAAFEYGHYDGRCAMIAWRERAWRFISGARSSGRRGSARSSVCAAISTFSTSIATSMRIPATWPMAS